MQVGYSRSLFGIHPSNMVRTLTHPLGNPCNYSTGSYPIFTSTVIAALREIQQRYTHNLANQSYADIPTDYSRYLYLYTIINRTVVSDPQLQILFDITKEGLKGSLRVYDLQYRNIELTVQNAALRAQIQDLLDGVNIKTVIESCGTLCATKTFTLAPIFSYYILVYGMPIQGHGFDEAKLAVLIPILEANGIQPYG